MSDCFKQILEKYKRAPDIVVNSAGITKDGFLLRMKEEDFDQVIDDWEKRYTRLYLVSRLCGGFLLLVLTCTKYSYSQ